MVIVRVCRDETGNSFLSAKFGHLIQDGVLGIVIYTTVYDREIVTAVVDVEHIAVPHRVGFDNTHLFGINVVVISVGPVRVKSETPFCIFVEYTYFATRL